MPRYHRGATTTMDKPQNDLQYLQWSVIVDLHDFFLVAKKLTNTGITWMNIAKRTWPI